MKKIIGSTAVKRLILSLVPVFVLLLTTLPASAALKFHADRTNLTGDPVVFDGNVRIEHNNRSLSADHAEVDRSTEIPDERHFPQLRR